ncbi:serine hydrolase domain-containing protein [Qaidamihabitans albus]|uniref:serine hydrolase domain-containing protein n=1 Tax=Qaidamihabitans albus TaxID=2795733 RepID=UPI0027DB7438|nr:serine hydrolase domain-containing protein [Qaidamihabitans albus]
MRHAIRKTATVLTCSALLAGALSTGTATAATPDRIQDAMDATVSAGMPGVLAVTADDGREWSGTSGVGDVRTERAPRTDGRIRTGSVSKTFTATLVLQLADEGRIGLDDRISEYLPGLLPYAEPITVRQLLQHTSGLPRDLPPEATWASLPEVDTERFTHFAPTKVVELSTRQPLLFEPGTDWRYSNTGYTVLALLVEKVSGQRMERLLKERVLRPLGLHRTALVRDFPFLPHAAARGYEQLYEPPRPLTDVTTYNYSRYFGSGSVISTAAELNRFFGALLGGELLSEGMLAQMKRTVPARNLEGDYAGFDYGLGLMRLPLEAMCPGEPAVWGHNGSLPGYGTWSMHSEDGDTRITTAVNQNITAPPSPWTLVMVSAFCEPGQAPAAAAHSLPDTRMLALGPLPS